MLYELTDRGFEVVSHPRYQGGDRTPRLPLRLVGQSSAWSCREGDRAGTSYLWIGEHHHLNREEVRELTDRLTAWLTTGSLRVERDVTT